MEQFSLYAAVYCVAIAAYGSENYITVLNQTQLDIFTYNYSKVIKVLEPIEEITKSVSEELACISVVFTSN